MQIRRAKRADEERLGTIRHNTILALAVPILLQAEAETWAKQINEDRIGQAVRAHEVWVAEDEIAIGWVLGVFSSLLVRRVMGLLERSALP